MSLFHDINRRRLAIASLAVFLATLAVQLVAVNPALAATPTFVQARAKEINSGTVNSLAFNSANSAGNLVVVYVLWNNTGSVTLSDNRGNSYAAATTRATWGTNWSSQTFYAKGVAAGTNTVAATFATPITSFGIIYIHEYAGVDKTNSVDVTKSATGTSSAMSSGNFTTSNSSDLLFVGSASVGVVNQAGTGYTTRLTNYGNRTMDRTVTTAGTYNATARQNSNGWVMQAVAFKADSGVTDTEPPSVPSGLSATPASPTRVDLAWSASTDNVLVTSYKIFRDGLQIGTTPSLSFADSGLTPNTTYSYTVSAADAAGNNSAQSPAVPATTPTLPPDTTPPTVSLTAPADGATVSGNVQVNANASDDVGVAGVQFLLDGGVFGAEDTAPPYSVPWNTTAAVNGPHTLAARARDAASNLATSPTVNVTVSNSSATGPVAGYAFEEGSGTTAADATGHGLTGALNGASWTGGKYGTAVLLDGNDDYVDLGNPSALQITGGLTISAWVYSSAFPGDDAAIVSKRGQNGFQLDTTVDRGPRTIAFKLTSSTGSPMFRYGTTPLQLDTWYHVTGVYNPAAGALQVYLNGQLDNGDLVGAITASQQDSPMNVNIGRRASGGFLTNGRIDDVRIYGRALSQAEIQADMNTPLAGGTSTDPTPPSVSLTAPADGAQVSEIVNVSADATDNVGVVGVQFMVDGLNTGVEDTIAPYGQPWDSRAATNGVHTLTARARDAAGNTTVSAPISVNVANTNYFQNEILATGLDLPTNIEFLPDGRMLAVELQGKIKILRPPYTQPDPTPFLQLSNIGSAGVQQGIYDIVFDPNFASNRYYYIFYTAATPNRDRVSRFTANATLTGTVAGSEFILYEDPRDASSEHHGGALVFGNDGKLYFTTGEHFSASDAASLTNSRGKIHRVNPDGTVPLDNPFYDGAGPNVDSIWAYGLRNPFRAYYDAPTGRMFVGDVGGNDYSTAKEEINLGRAGANYGWPNSEGNCSAPCTSPLYSYPHNGRDASITGGFVYHGTQFPAGYQGSYFFADYTQNWIKRLTLDSNGNVTGVFNFEPANGAADGPYGDIVHLAEGPDGALYYVDLGYSDISGTFGVSKIRRIRYVQTNQAPVAVATANLTSGPIPLSVNFSSAGSLDPEGQPLTYSWTFGDGTTSTEANPTHTYTQAGPYNVRLTVADGVNSTLAPPVSVTAGIPPVATITGPADGVFFQAGDIISFSGEGTDAEDGILPASAFSWSIDFLHEGHVHPGLPQTGAKNGTFTIPTSGHDFAGNTRYRITLTVTDSDGLTNSRSVTIWPRKVNLSFDTQPSGLQLVIDGIPRPTGFVLDSLVGFIHTIEARTQTIGSTTYSFLSWSDGGAQTHDIVTPSAAQTITATFNAVLNPQPISFVQTSAATPQTDQATVSRAYASAQTAGNTNIIAIGWNSSSGTISSITDSSGNVYQVAAPIARGSGLSQAIYFANNIAGAPAGGNSVTVTFSSAQPYVDLRISEYGGLSPTNPVDVASSSSGTSNSATSGTVTTRGPNELLFAAGTTIGSFSGATGGFATRIITNPDADIVQDRIVNATGSYAATASLAGSAAWLMQLVTFRGAM
jgi:glucose/arabinose dehydrogenase/chitodextrinase